MEREVSAANTDLLQRRSRAVINKAIGFFMGLL
jgi:hypothetical protein